MAVPRIPVRCDGCGKTDDHPKHNYGDLTFHYDCSPAFVVDDMTSVSDWVWDDGQKVLHRRDPLPEDSYHPATAHFLRVREAALAGKHGDDLLTEALRLHAKHKPHEDTDGAEKFRATAEKIKMEQHDVRPAHLRQPEE